MNDKECFVIFAAEEDWQVHDVDAIYEQFKKDNIVKDVYTTHAFQYQYAASTLNLSAQGFIEPSNPNGFNYEEEQDRLQKGKNFLDYFETMILKDMGEDYLKTLKLKVEMIWGDLNNNMMAIETGTSQN